MSVAKTAARSLLRVNEAMASLLLRPVLYLDSAGPPSKKMNERPAEYAFALEALMASRAETVLDVGPGLSSWPHLLSTCGFRTTAIDKIDKYWSGFFSNRHFRVLRDDVTKPKIGGQFDAITCLSVLEHIPDHAAAVRGMFSLLRPGGHLVMTFPYCETRYCGDVYKVPGATYGANYRFICQMYSRAQVDIWLSETPATIIEQRYWEACTGDLWAHGERLRPPLLSSAEGKHQLSGIVLRKSEA